MNAVDTWKHAPSDRHEGTGPEPRRRAVDPYINTADLALAMQRTLADAAGSTPGSTPAATPGMSRADAAELGLGAVEHQMRFAQVASRLELGQPRAVAQAIGKFHVVRRIGEGGMGVVYHAYDPDLDRSVAIKLLHPRLLHDHQLLVAEQRMRREARAMARVGHRNVVAIHDVAVHEGQLYLAMEYVNGRTLTEWLRARPRGWRAVVEMFLRAGEGLAAAHDAGLVHRDFKPDNVLVGEGEEVKVTDFGLANSFGMSEAESVTSTFEREVTLNEMTSSSITRTGALMGTPLYMAPEQLLGQQADARSDQFGFSVALYEALTGAHPFDTSSMDALRRSVLRGELAARPAHVDAPGWVFRILERGLRTAPDERWPELRDMLTALRADPRRRRRRALAWGGAALGLALGLGVYEGAGRLALAQQRSACAAEGAAVEAHYNDDVRARLRAALSIASPAHGATTAEKALAWLDRYADEWRAVRVETCEAAEIRGELDVAARERVDWCLEDKRTALAIYVDEFSGQRERAVHRAVTAAASLPAIATCNDVQLLSRLPAPPAALREQLRATREQLARARTVELAGDSREALALATSARARAEQLAWPPLYARAGVMLGRYQMHTGAYEDAEKSLERSYFEAASARAVDVEADAALELSFLLGEVVGRLDDGMRWSRLAGVALDEIGSGPSSAMRDAMIRAYRGNILMAMEQPEAGKLLIEESLAIVARTFPPDHPYVANAIHELARINHKLEHLEQSAAQYERALAMREEIYGPLHPGVSDTLNNLANVVGDLGDHARAVAMLERSLEIREGTFGPSHPVVAQTLNNLAIEYNVPGQRARARAAHERALAIREGTFGAEHRLVGESLVNLATVLHDDGDLDGARAQINRAIAVFERALGPEHPLMVAALSLLGSVHETAGALPEARAVYERALAIEEQRGGSSQLLMATLLGNLASVDLQQGALDAAERGARRALAIEETVRGPENAEAGSLTALLADVAMARGQTQEAIALNERALALLVRDAKLERRLADAQLSLARALRADPRERERTRELIGRALTIYRKDPAASAEMIREAEALLSAT